MTTPKVELGARLPAGAAVYIETPDGVLAISRGDDLGDWSIPGGSVEPTETAEAAASRELAEETGVTVAPRHLRLLATIGSSAIYTPLSDRHVRWPERLRSEPFEGWPAIMPPELLAASPTHGRSFRMLMQVIGKRVRRFPPALISHRARWLLGQQSRGTASVDDEEGRDGEDGDRRCSEPPMFASHAIDEIALLPIEAEVWADAMIDE